MGGNYLGMTKLILEENRSNYWKQSRRLEVNLEDSWRPDPTEVTLERQCGNRGIIHKQEMETEIKILRWKQYICTTSNFKLQLANANNVFCSGIA